MTARVIMLRPKATLSSDGGFYLMYRGWLNNPALGAGREPFCRRAAWAWLIEEAAWAETRIDVGGKTVVLSRGQLSYSVRYLASAWKWHRSAVERLLDRLKTEAMIETESGHGRLLITICNYEKYQSPSNRPCVVSETPAETAARQQRDSSETKKKEGKEDNELRKKVSHSSAVADAVAQGDEPSADAEPLPKRKGVTRQPRPPGATQDLVTAFERWWSEYPRVRRVDKADTLKAYLKARGVADENTLLNGLRSFVFDQRDNGKWIVHPQRWLSRQKWLDDPASQVVRSDAQSDWLSERRAKRAQAAQREMPFDGPTLDGEILEAELV